MKKQCHLLNTEDHNSASVRIFKLRISLIRKLGMKMLEELNFLDLNENQGLADGLNLYEEVRKFEIDLIKVALCLTAGNQSEAAKLLQTNVTTLNSKIKKLRISVHPWGTAAHPSSPQRPKAVHSQLISTAGAVK